MDELIEKHVAICISYQVCVNTPVQEPVQSTILPDYPWQVVDIDFLGPLPSRYYIMVAIDEYSFPRDIYNHVYCPRTNHLDKLCSSYGIPEVIKTDNGPPFKSRGFKSYSKHMGFKHRRITPLHPRANGLVENCNRMITKVLKIARIECKPWKTGLLAFLLNYRATIHLTTGKSPAELFFAKRPFRTRFGDFKNTTLDNRQIREHDKRQKEKAKASADDKSYVKMQDVKAGDKVLVKVKKANKFCLNYDPIPYTITENKGRMITASRNHPPHTITRNTSQFKKLKYEVEVNEFSEGDVDIENAHPRRPSRPRRRPIRYPEDE